MTSAEYRMLMDATMDDFNDGKLNPAQLTAAINALVKQRDAAIDKALESEWTTTSDSKFFTSYSAETDLAISHRPYDQDKDGGIY